MSSVKCIQHSATIKDKKHLGINLVLKPWICWAGGKRGGGEEFCCARSAMKRWNRERFYSSVGWVARGLDPALETLELGLLASARLVSEKAKTAQIIPPAKAAAFSCLLPTWWSKRCCRSGTSLLWEHGWASPDARCAAVQGGPSAPFWKDFFHRC